MKPTTQCEDVVTGEGTVTAIRPAVGGRVHLGYFLVGGVAPVGMVAVSMIGGTKVIQDVDRAPPVGVAKSTANSSPDAGLNSPVGPGAAPAPNQPDRVGGGGAAATAIQVFRCILPGSAAEVCLAHLGNPADILAASVMPNGPILLILIDGNVPLTVLEEIKHLSPGKVALLGGKSAISDNVAGQITTYTGRSTVQVSGANRIATAAAIVSYVCPGRNPMVYVVDTMGTDGKGSPDVVVAGASIDGPIITATANGGDITIAMQAAEAFGANRVVTLGGRAAVSDAAPNQVAGSSATDRISGPSRYQTLVAIGQRVFGASAGNVYLVSGTNLAYALVAGSPTDNPIILVPGIADGNIRGLVTSLGSPNANAISDGSPVSDSVLQVAAGCAQSQATQQPQKPSAPVAGVGQVYVKYSMQLLSTDGAHEEAIYNAINETYVGHEVPALTRDPVMDGAARAWAQQVARTDVFVHSNEVLRYADLFPAGWKYAGKNMVRYHNIEPGPYVVGCNDLRVRSPGHYKNLIGGHFSRIGVGAATKHTWVYAVQNFSQY